MAEAQRSPSAATTELIVVSAIFPALSAVAYYLRLLSRRSTRDQSRADDYWLAFTWITTVPLSILVWVVAGRSGIQYYKIDAATGTRYSLFLVWFSSVILQIPETTVKIAILLFYKRIFSTRNFVISVWIGIATISIWGIIFFILILIQVDPVSKTWTGLGTLRYDSTALGLAQVGSSIALDIIVLCFPLPVISKLNMKKSRKIGVGLIFWLGAFCCIAAIVRLVLLKQSLQTIVDDETKIYLQGSIIIWKIIEPNVSIIAACLPCYGPLMKSRSMESITRSLRSIFSLSSLRSRRSGGTLRWRRNGRRNNSLAQLDKEEDSRVELHYQEQQRPEKCATASWAVGGNHSQGITCLSNDSLEQHDTGISVIRGVTIDRE